MSQGTYAKPKTVSDTADWKQKYRDSLLEMEAEEKRWREIEQLLRRLIGRLCAAGMGVDRQLDDELTAIAAANRRNADATELERLAQSLTTAVVAVDATSPVRHLAVQMLPAAQIPAAAPPVAAPPPAAISARWHLTCTGLPDCSIGSIPPTPMRPRFRA
jgi:diguanylate cyclase